jgi:hypothetical protein
MKSSGVENFSPSRIHSLLGSEKKGSLSFALCQSSAVGFCALRKCECFEKSCAAQKKKERSPFSECSPVKGYQTEKRPLRLQCKRAQERREIDSTARSLVAHTSNFYSRCAWGAACVIIKLTWGAACELDERGFSQSLPSAIKCHFLCRVWASCSRTAIFIFARPCCPLVLRISCTLNLKATLMSHEEKWAREAENQIHLRFSFILKSWWALSKSEKEMRLLIIDFFQLVCNAYMSSYLG